MNNTRRRWTFCAAVLAGAIAAGCAENQPTGPGVKSAPESAEKTLLSGDPDPFFVAWSANYSSDPIRTQVWSGPDSRQYRQYTGMYADGGVLAFAAANPGKLYINGDEPDQSCISPYDYAGIYHDYVAAVRGADPTARVSPAGFAEPNSACCPDPPGACFDSMHSVSYADQFYSRYIERYGVAPPVTEWRFHDFGLIYQGNIAAWWARVSNEAAWSVSHGAPMVLGSWGFLDWSEDSPTFQAHMQEAMNLVRNDGRINQAVWWSYENTGYPHYLANSDGTLTPEGQTYSNPPPPPPFSASISGAQYVTRYQSAQYFASTTNGNAPFTYEWRTRQCTDSQGFNCGAWQDWYSTGSQDYTYASINSCGLVRNELQGRVTGGDSRVTTSSTYPIWITNPC
jgi:hypothetical protein